MRFSLVVTTFDRQKELERLFSSISNQSLDSQIEVVLVNQGSLSPPALPPRIPVTEINTNACVSLSKARNLGLARATGEIIGFPDDDCWYEPDLIGKISQYFEENQNTDCICTNIFDPYNQKSYGHRPVDIILPITFGNLTRLPASAGIFLRRCPFEHAGAWFDESLGVGTEIGSAEETELVARLLDAKLRADYVGTIQVYHPVLSEYMANDANKCYNYGLGFGYINGLLLRTGHWAVLFHLFEVILRSMAGFVLNCGHPITRTVYWNRFQGILMGLVDGIRR